jgi:hypothetical protein
MDEAAVVKASDWPKEVVSAAHGSIACHSRWLESSWSQATARASTHRARESKIVRPSIARTTAS